MLFSRSAALNLLLPVGLMRSPMMTGLGPISTVCENEETTVRCLGTGGRNGTRHGTFSMVSRRCWRRAAAAAERVHAHACDFFHQVGNSAGAISNTVVPFFAARQTGIRDNNRKRGNLGQTLDDRLLFTGPRPQLTPSASTRSPRAWQPSGIHRAAGEAACPFSSKMVVTTTGRSQFSLAASTAALAS